MPSLRGKPKSGNLLILKEGVSENSNKYFKISFCFKSRSTTKKSLANFFAERKTKTSSNFNFKRNFIFRSRHTEYSTEP